MIAQLCPWILFALLGSLQSSQEQSSDSEGLQPPTLVEQAAVARTPLDRVEGRVATRSLELGTGLGCQPSWIPSFGGAQGVVGRTLALAAHDDGSGAGSALYVGGIGRPFIARWDGASWSSLGAGMDNTVDALAVYDDGSGNGPALYAGGKFMTPASRIAKWDGTSWTPLGTGLPHDVLTLAVYDDGSGSGPELYAGGSFPGCIRKWNGTSWSSVGSGLDNTVVALTVYDDGSGGGPALYASGYFSGRIAKWDGTVWSGVGGGLNDVANALTVYDDGSGAGPALVAAGRFSLAGGVSANRIAKWDGTTWSPLAFGLFHTAESLTVHDDGSGGGPALYVGGHFQFASGVPANYVARWDGATWSALLDGVNGAVHALLEYDDGSGAGPALYIGGDFTSASGVTADSLTKWSGGSWFALGGAGLNDHVNDLVVHDDGAGAGVALYVGGAFEGAGGLALNHVAKWNGASWSAVGTGIPHVYALAVHDDGSGSGPTLYASGASFIAEWDGTAWSSLGGANGIVRALAVHDDGSGGGPALYAGGEFTSIGGIGANRIAKWDGTSWSALGSGANDVVHALAVYDDGSGGGPALHAGGRFTQAGGTSASRIARWDGTSWSALGSGATNWVNALAVHDDGLGGGPALYAGGEFTLIGGAIASRIAKWDGTSWTPLGTGVSDAVFEISAYDDGTGGGASLYVGGYFLEAGGMPAPRLARWNGVSWSAVGPPSLADSVRAITAYDPGAGAGPALVVGGDFAVSSAGDSFVALWGGCAGRSPGTSYCFGDGTGAPCPCGNESGAGRGCANGSGFGALLDAAGTGSVAADDAVLFCGGLVPNQPGLYFQGDSAINGGLGIPFGDGLRCAGGAVERLEVVNADAMGFSQSSVSLVTEGGVSPGDTKRYQLWYRDPLTSPCGTGFNLSNGSSIAWQP